MDTGNQFVAKNYISNPEMNWTINKGDTLHLYEKVSNGLYTIGYNAVNKNTNQKMYLGGEEILYLKEI